MKRSILTLLIITYIAISSGVPLNIHYCMGKLMEVGLWQDDTHSSSCADTSSDKSEKCSTACCSDEQQFLKMDIEQNNVPAQEIDYNPIILALLFDEIDSSFHEKTRKPIVSRSLPKCSGSELCIRNCSFLI